MNQSPRPAIDQRDRSRAVFVWSLLWGILAVLHVTQSIWLNGGRAYPGDLGDGRFNQLLLEHGHQALRGMATWSSPGQFFPVKDTLAFSDTHAGTLPIYTIIRRLGVSRDEAWQLWFVAVAALNVVAAFRLFRALGVTPVLRGPAVFATAASTLMVWLAGTHMQMLPVFPALLAWEQVVRWSQDRRPRRLATAFGWFCWQFAAGPYSAFFAAVIASCVGFGRLMLGRPGEDAIARRPSTEPARWWNRAVALLVFLTGTTLALVVARVYLTGLQAGHSRPISEIIDGAPALTSWFTAPPVSYWYSPGWPGGQRNLVEHAWFAGFLAWGLNLASVVTGKQLRRSGIGRWSLALALGTVGVVLFFTKWNEGGAGVWVYLAGKIGPLHAFRSSGRVAALMQFPLIGAGALLLTWWTNSARNRAINALCVSVGCVAALENVSHHQPSTPLAAARARTDALVAAWRDAGDRPILAFAPGYTNQSDAWIQLDCWSATLALHRVTINGYSGGLPASHVAFAWNPQPEQARELIRATGIPADDVSLVESLGAEAEARLNFQRLHERQLRRLEDFDVQPVGWVLFAPLETFEVDGRIMYQFTPPAAVRFAIPATATRISLNVRMRPGSYELPGDSDGVGLTWILRARNALDKELRHEAVHPRERERDRATLHFELDLPPGDDRVLVLRIDPGPDDNNAWDWPLFGSLRVY